MSKSVFRMKPYKRYKMCLVDGIVMPKLWKNIRSDESKRLARCYRRKAYELERDWGDTGFVNEEAKIYWEWAEKLDQWYPILKTRELIGA